MKAPLDQFAERIVRNGEVQEFVTGLLEKGAKEEDVEKALDEMNLRKGIHTIRSPKLEDWQLRRMAAFQ